jgi:hypothetical protein
MQEAFGQALDWALRHALGILDSTIGEAIRAVVASFDAYNQGILNAFVRMAEEQKVLGYVTQATLEEAAHAVQQPLYWALLGISVGIYAAVLALAPLTFSIGAAVGAVALLVVTYLVQRFLVESLQAEDSGGPAIGPDTLLEAMVDAVQNWWERETQLTDEDTRNFWTTVGWYVSWGGLMFGTYVWGSVLKMTGAMDIPYDLLFGALALVLAHQILQTTGEVAIIFSILAAVVGSIGIYFAVKFLSKAWTNLAPPLKLLGSVGLVMGLSAAGIGVWNLVF